MNTQSQTKMAMRPAQEYNGADAVIAALKNQEVKVLFGIVGGSIMPVYDALYRDGTLNHIIAGHEQGAAHMAEGFARATGRAGVVVTTSGPGATNLVTGLANAMMDSVPLVAITGQVNSTLLGNDAFQEADMWGITMPITKHNYQVSSPQELAQIFAEAFYVALSGRPGPVLVDLPKDVGMAPCPRLLAIPEPPEGYDTPYEGDPYDMAKALALLRQAKRPVVLAGGGVIIAGACPELRSLAEGLSLPVTSTLMGLGNFPRNHPLSLGMPGMHGTAYANLALHHCDLLLCVGCRLDDRVTGQVERFAPRAQLIHIDVDASEIGKILPPQAPIVGDAKPVLKSLAEQSADWRVKPDFQLWLKQIAQWKRTYPLGYRRKDGVIMPQQAIEALGRLLDEDTIIATGVGQHQMFAAQYYPFKRPRTFITSGGLGTMGFGLPASLGAKMGCPHRTVVCLDGDGSFLMNIQELATAVRYRIGVVVVVLNNSYLGMVRQWQEMFFENRVSETKLQCPAYDQVARAFGGLGRRVERPKELEPAIKWALAQAKEQSLPVVLDVQVEPESRVLPMVPPGQANVDFIPCER